MGKGGAIRGTHREKKKNRFWTCCVVGPNTVEQDEVGKEPAHTHEKKKVKFWRIWMQVCSRTLGSKRETAKMTRVNSSWRNLFKKSVTAQYLLLAVSSGLELIILWGVSLYLPWVRSVQYLKTLQSKSFFFLWQSFLSSQRELWACP